MKNDIEPQRIANAVRMDKQFTAFLIVEGKSDYLFFKKFTDSSTCDIIIALGKQIVIETIKILNHSNFNAAVGIVDNDFDLILESVEHIDNVIKTDHHDLELSIVTSPTLDIILQHHCSEEKIKSIKVDDVRNMVLQLASHIGYIKLANAIYKFGFGFKPINVNGNPLPISDFIDNKTLDYLGDEALIQTVYNYNVNRLTGKLDRQLVEEAYSNVKKNTYDKLHLCNGHDVIVILQLAFRKKLGNKNIPCKDLESDFILAYDSTYFKTTEIYQKLIKWQDNTKIKVLQPNLA